MQDNFGRTIDYLRVALTDRCNLRCWYCVGRGDHRHLPAERQLSHNEFVRVLRIAVERLGIAKIRLTGGEPLLYPRLEELIVRLRSFGQLRELFKRRIGQEDAHDNKHYRVFKDSNDNAFRVEEFNENAIEQAEYLESKYGPGPEPDFDDIEDFASGGIARMLGE